MQLAYANGTRRIVVNKITNSIKKISNESRSNKICNNTKKVVLII